MKQETKELLDYIISQFNTREAIFDGMPEDEKAKAHIYNYRQDKIQDFLKSIPEIESKLCRGGYIQDKNGTPCCDGDRVLYNNKIGKLAWTFACSKFQIELEDGDIIINFSRKDIEKVE